MKHAVMFFIRLTTYCDTFTTHLAIHFNLQYTPVSHKVVLRNSSKSAAKILRPPKMKLMCSMRRRRRRRVGETRVEGGERD